jgi:hypothetical protein
MISFAYELDVDSFTPMTALWSGPVPRLRWWRITGSGHEQQLHITKSGHVFIGALWLISIKYRLGHHSDYRVKKGCK